MALPTNADVIVVQGYWWDETTGQGVRSANNTAATVTFDPVPLSGSSTRTPNLRDLTASGYLKTRQRVATVDLTTGYFAARLVSSNDPDLDAYGGRKVTFLGEEPFTVEVPYNASTTTVTAQMAAATGLTQGATVKAVWLADLALITTPTPTPSVNYLTSAQTVSTVTNAVAAHDEDADAHADIRSELESLDLLAADGGNSLFRGGGVETAPRFTNLMDFNGVSGRMWLSYFTPPLTTSLGQLAVNSAGTTTASATLARLALFLVNSDHSLTRVAVTTSDNTIGASSYTEYKRAFSGTYTVTAGQRYAIGFLQVASTPMALRGSGPNGAFSDPIVASYVDGQADIAASYTAGSLTTWWQAVYFTGTA